MIKLVTGLPGSGKSLTAVELLYMAAKREGRPIYVCGIDGLADGPWMPLADPLGWEQLPDGSLIIVDEAQKYFPARRSEPTPPVKALSEHRHRGFDFVLVTQHPMMLDSYVRKLVGEHVHVVRKFGTQVTERVTWSEVVDDPQSQAMRSRGVKQVWKYPKDLFAMYKSASLHTGKSRVPLRVYALPLLLLGGLAMAYLGIKMVAGFGRSESVVAAPEPPVEAPLKSAPFQSPSSEPAWRSGPKTAAEWATFLTPRIEGLPWTAPAFDGRHMTNVPRLYCASTRYRCVCHTEQGTNYALRDAVCRDLAINGLYYPIEPARSPLEAREEAAERESNRSNRRTARDDEAASEGLSRVAESPMRADYRPETMWPGGGGSP